MIIMNLKSKIKLKRVTKLDLRFLIEWRNSKNIFPYNTQYFLLNSKMQMDWFNKIQNDSTKKNVHDLLWKIKNWYLWFNRYR